MSVCRARSLSLFGTDALPVEVEVNVGAGLPGFSIVGLPDAAVQKAREWVRAAISNSGYEFPRRNRRLQDTFPQGHQLVPARPETGLHTLMLPDPVLQRRLHETNQVIRERRIATYRLRADLQSLARPSAGCRKHQAVRVTTSDKGP